jgi:hypothetical protein
MSLLNIARSIDASWGLINPRMYNFCKENGKNINQGKIFKALLKIT